MKLVLEGGDLEVDEKNQVYQIEDANQVMIVMAAETDYKMIIQLTVIKRKI